MEFLFDLLLTAFFSLFFAFLLSKLFSTSSSSSASASSSSHGAADAISGGAQSPRLREGEDLQEEKIIEVDNVVEREAEGGFLAEEVSSELSESVGIGSGKVDICERNEGRSDVFVCDVELEKGKGDRGLVHKYESFESETSIDFGKEKESFRSEIGVVNVAQSLDSISVQNQSSVPQEESLWEVKLSDSEVEKVDGDNLCEVEGPEAKMPIEVRVPTMEDTVLKEKHEFKAKCHGSVILQEKLSQDTVVSDEIEKGKDETHNLCEVEGFISKTATEGEAHLKELIVPEEISVKATESSEEISVEVTESSGQKKGEEQEKVENLSKAEGPTSKIVQLVEIGEKDKKEKDFNEEEEWEGIERTDVEKQFAVAAGFANSVCGTDALLKLSNEAQLQLYGLHKVATEGPCYESHPLALRASTRAKWHAWQKLGNMNPETAMEEYITLLSKNVPNWCEQPIVDIEHKESDQLTIESGSCIKGPTAFGYASPEKGTESHASPL